MGSLLHVRFQLRSHVRKRFDSLTLLDKDWGYGVLLPATSILVLLLVALNRDFGVTIRRLSFRITSSNRPILLQFILSCRCLARLMLF